MAAASSSIEEVAAGAVTEYKQEAAAPVVSPYGLRRREAAAAVAAAAMVAAAAGRRAPSADKRAGSAEKDAGQTPAAAAKPQRQRPTAHNDSRKEPGTSEAVLQLCACTFCDYRLCSLSSTLKSKIIAILLVLFLLHLHNMSVSTWIAFFGHLQIRSLQMWRLPAYIFRSVNLCLACFAQAWRTSCWSASTAAGMRRRRGRAPARRRAWGSAAACSGARTRTGTRPSAAHTTPRSARITSGTSTTRRWVIRPCFCPAIRILGTALHSARKQSWAWILKHESGYSWSRRTLSSGTH